MVGEIQDDLPERMHVILPGKDFQPLSFRVATSLPTTGLCSGGLRQRRWRRRTCHLSDPVPQCDIRRWWPVCDRRQRHDDDHLCLAAGISRLQINELRSWGVDTPTALAELPLPLERRPSRGAVETYERVREQARSSA